MRYYISFRKILTIFDMTGNIRYYFLQQVPLNSVKLLKHFLIKTKVQISTNRVFLFNLTTVAAQPKHFAKNNFAVCKQFLNILAQHLTELRPKSFIFSSL